LVDKPLIQYAVDEAVAAGADTLIFVTSAGKQAIEEHFNAAPALERVLREHGRDELLQCVRDILPARVQTKFIIQPEPLGLGHAVLCARPGFGPADETFGVILPDELILDIDGGCLGQMHARCRERGVDSMVAVDEVPWAQTHRYGVVETQRMPCGDEQITGMQEKPPAGSARSNFAIIGRYLLSTRIFALLEHTAPGAGGEIQLTDALAELAREQTVLAHHNTGARYDCGSKAEFLQATVELGLRHPALGEAFARFVLDRAVNLDLQGKPAG